MAHGTATAAAVQHITDRNYFPKLKTGEETKRRFRIFGAKIVDRNGNEQQKKRGDLNGRRYKTALRAHDQALLLVRWEHEGTVFEVYDFQRGELIGVYRREEKSVDFTVLKGGK